VLRDKQEQEYHDELVVGVSVRDVVAFARLLSWDSWEHLIVNFLVIVSAFADDVVLVVVAGHHQSAGWFLFLAEPPLHRVVVW
jgi:hypothetical protein